MRSRLTTVLVGLICLGSLATAGGADEKKQDDKQRDPATAKRVLDLFSYTHTAGIFGSMTTVTVTRQGKVKFFYISQPYTGSGGLVISKDWDITAKEAAAFLDGLVADGLLELKDEDKGPVPTHIIVVSSGDWSKAIHPKELPAAIEKRVAPFLLFKFPLLKDRPR